MVCTRPELFNEELQHLREALVKCKYPRWAINKVQSKYIHNNWEENNSNNNNQEDTSAQSTNRSNNSTKERPPGKTHIGHIVIPYIQGLGKSFKKICRRYGIQTHFKGNRTLKQLFVKPKDQDPKERKSGVIYSYQCWEITCDEEYIGETSRTLGEKFREHLKEPLPIHVHTLQSGHNATQEDLNIIGREDQGLARTIKESIYIRVNNLTLNRNIGKFNLNHIWDRVLMNTLGLKIISPNGYVYTCNSGHAQSIPISGICK